MEPEFATETHRFVPVQARRPIFVFDTETTGLTARDSLVEIAVTELPVTSGREGLHSFSSLIHPKGVQVPRASTRIHGITNAMLQDAPHFRAAWKAFEEYIKYNSANRGRPILVAHNLPFDLRFIKEELARIGHELPPWDFADSLRDVAHVVWPGEKGSLAAIVERLGLVHDEAHRALSDVEATCQFLQQADDVLAERTAKGSNGANLEVQPGDFIYSLLVQAADRRNDQVSVLWRDETTYLEGSISDSATELSASPRSTSETQSSSMQSFPDYGEEQSKNSEVYEAANGGVFHLDQNCIGLQSSSSTNKLAHSNRPLCRLCATESFSAKNPISPIGIHINGVTTVPPVIRSPSHGMKQLTDISRQFSSADNQLRNEKMRRTSPRLNPRSDPGDITNMELAPAKSDSGAPVYFTSNGACYHKKSDCYGLRSAFNVRVAAKPLDGQRPCNVCCD